MINREKEIKKSVELDFANGKKNIYIIYKNSIPLTKICKKNLIFQRYYSVVRKQLLDLAEKSRNDRLMGRLNERPLCEAVHSLG